MADGRMVLRAWPRKRPQAATPAEADNRLQLAAMSNVSLYMDAHQQEFSYELARRTTFNPRDLLMMSLFGRIGTIVLTDGRKLFTMAAYQDVSKLLDAIGQQRGMILVRTDDFWQNLEIGNPDEVLTVDPDGLPSWQPGGGGGGGGWTNLAISGTSFGAGWSMTENYACGAPIAVSPGDFLTFRFLADRDNNHVFQVNLSPDGQKNCCGRIQGDNNYVTYYFSTFGGSESLISGGTFNQNFGGSHLQVVTLQVGASGQQHLWDCRANNGYAGNYFKGVAAAESDMPILTSGTIQVSIGTHSSAPSVPLLAQYQVMSP